MKTHRITFRLSDQLHERLRLAARRNGTQPSVFIRKAIERQFAEDDQKLTAYQLAQKAGIIGAIKNAPRDLSTNPKHFKGFGES